ncbi:MAG: hypothetical protein LBI19_03590 [Oscillospiraceae bacterium]|jgi:hypothetical protein|nr:hypothetical protein [Oscillospiraceae bacterium]
MFVYWAIHTEDSQINVGLYDLLFVRSEPRLSSSSVSYEEYLKYSKQNEGYEGFIETEVVDAFYDGFFSKNAANIFPAYHKYDTIEGGRLIGYVATGATESFIPVLKSQSVKDDMIELTFTFFLQSIDSLFDFVYGTSSSTQVGRYDRNEYIVDGDAMDGLPTLKYTFIFEDGKYKIYSIEKA